MILIALAGLAYWTAGVIDAWELDLHWDRHIQAPLTYDSDTDIVSDVKPEAKAAAAPAAAKPSK